MLPVKKALLIEDNPIEAHQTEHWLRTARDGPFEVETVDQLHLGIERLAQGGIDIILLDLNLPDSRGLETLIRLRSEVAQVPIVVLTGEYDNAVGPLAIEHGAHDYVVKQQADAGSLVRVLRFALARHRVQADLLTLSQRGKPAKVLAVLGVKGGMGATTVAVNVAISLAAQNQSVILLELQAGFGTLAHHLQQPAVANLSNLCELSVDRIDARALDDVLCRGPAGLRVLFGPQSDNPIRGIEPKQAAAIVHGLSRMADYIVIDMPHVLTGAAQGAIGQCHAVVLATDREPGSIFCAKAMLHQLSKWGAGGHRVGAVVVDSAISPLLLQASAIPAQLGCELIGSVPSDANACLVAQESGVPIVLSAPGHTVSLSLMAIAARIKASSAMAPVL